MDPSTNLSGHTEVNAAIINTFNNTTAIYKNDTNEADGKNARIESSRTPQGCDIREGWSNKEDIKSLSTKQHLNGVKSWLERKMMSQDNDTLEETFPGDL